MPISAAVLEALQRDPRRAISENVIVCLVCGRSFRHLTNTHVADPSRHARGGTRARAFEELLSRRESGRRDRSRPTRESGGRFVRADVVAEVS